jgi:hypothetical protein
VVLFLRAFAGVHRVRDRAGERHQPQAARDGAHDGARGGRPGRAPAQHGGGAQGSLGARVRQRAAQVVLPGGGDRRSRALPARRLPSAGAAEPLAQRQTVCAHEAGRARRHRAELQTLGVLVNLVIPIPPPPFPPPLLESRSLASRFLVTDEFCMLLS